MAEAAGYGMTRTADANPLQTIAVAYAMIGAFFAMERRLRQGEQAQSLQESEFDRRSTRIVGVAFFVSLLAMLAAPILNIRQVGRLKSRHSVGWIGIGLMVGGIGLRTWANKTLGASYTRTLRVTERQPLIEHGPYRLVRHPGYSGSLLLWLGAGLATMNGISTAVIATAAALAYLYRIETEEAMLQTTFGQRFQEYAARTWRLIPFII